MELITIEFEVKSSGIRNTIRSSMELFLNCRLSPFYFALFIAYFCLRSLVTLENPIRS